MFIIRSKSSPAYGSQTDAVRTILSTEQGKTSLFSQLQLAIVEAHRLGPDLSREISE